MKKFRAFLTALVIYGYILPAATGCYDSDEESPDSTRPCTIISGTISNWNDFLKESGYSATDIFLVKTVYSSGNGLSSVDVSSPLPVSDDGSFSLALPDMETGLPEMTSSNRNFSGIRVSPASGVYSTLAGTGKILTAIHDAGGAKIADLEYCSRKNSINYYGNLVFSSSPVKLAGSFSRTDSDYDNGSACTYVTNYTCDCSFPEGWSWLYGKSLQTGSSDAEHIYYYSDAVTCKTGASINGLKWIAYKNEFSGNNQEYIVLNGVVAK